MKYALAPFLHFSLSLIDLNAFDILIALNSTSKCLKVFNFLPDVKYTSHSDGMNQDLHACFKIVRRLN